MRRLFPSQELFILDFNASIYIENFIISAVTSILVIRIFLGLTGYPQLGGESLHIAHMLWGGFLLMLALGITLSFINKEAKRTASVIGGIGFGVFIDELGKFLTHDNNYFFQPTIAILYIIFLLIFFGFKKLFDLIEKDEKEYAINALEILKEAVFYDLDQTEKAHILKYLKKADKNSVIIQELIKLIENTEALPAPRHSRLAKIKILLRKKYLKIITSSKFIKVLLIIFIVGSFSNLFSAIQTLYSYQHMDFWDWGLSISILLSGLFLLIGLKDYPRRKVNAYLNFKRAAMVSVLFTQFFTFYYQQLAALIPLITSFSTYLGLQALIEEEHLT